MIKLIRTNSDHQDFIKLVQSLNDYLKVTDGDEHEFYNQYNNIDVLKHVVVAYYNNIPAGCGAFKKFNTETVEIKRMYTVVELRGKGIASQIIKELEHWAQELLYKSCVLETGKRQLEAVSFYKKMNYKVIPNYGQYQGISNSLCFKKELNEKG
ncbi:GNAT family N-acetyltransferase [Tamlana sp. 2201CG12-4]|uniref:GNAT family N-acetyltransferase n=1 Tax=Tamlana sp. 2201CG12-4 TaxID=3112582 RepID=UPI002DB562DC|nr:GNAT family N-acetyltransferase [Tamlana sp. 2201CG12-4]MEC3907594.1 GNAT family N-acetyltransferase [Tamlana sp. 2201CG12-4]